MADVTFTIDFQDDGTPVLRNIRRGVDDVGTGAERASNRASSGFSKFQATIVTVNQALQLGRTIISGLTSLVSSFAGAVQDAAQAAAVQEAAEVKRNQALRNAGQLTREYAAELNQQAAAFQAVTTTGDEVTIGLQAQLIAFGASREEMQELTQASLDLAAGLGTDLSSAALLMGKALAGEFSTLSRYGIFVDENATKSEKLAQALDQINSRFGGQAQAQAETYAGKIQQLSNTWGDLQEEVGFALTQNQSLVNILALVQGQIQSLSAFVKENREEVSQWISEGLIVAIDLLAKMAMAASLTAKALAGLKFALQVLSNPAQLDDLRQAWADVQANFEAVDTATAALNGLLDQLKKSADDGAKSGDLLAAALDSAGAAGKAAATGAKAAGDETKKLTDDLTDQIAEVKEQIATIGLSERGLIDYQAAQLAVKTGAADLAEEWRQQSLVLLELTENLERKKELDKEIAEQLTEQFVAERERDAAQAALQQSITRTQKEFQGLTKIIKEGIAAGRTYDSVTRDIAVAHEQARLTAEGYAGDIERTAIATVDAERAYDDATNALRDYEQAQQDAILTTRDLGQAITDSLVNLDTSGLERLGQDIGTRFFDQILVGKSNFDQTLIGNFSGLFGQGGILGSLFDSFSGTATSTLGNVGQQSGQAFNAGFVEVVDDIFSGQGFSGAVNSPGGGTATQTSSGLAGIFGQQGITSGQAFSLGFLATVSNILNAPSTGGKIGAGLGGIGGGILGFAIGGPAGAAIGASIGSAIGGAIGDALDSIFGGPGRIEAQKKKIEEFVEDALGIKVHATFERFRAAAEENFAGVENALESLGATFALQSGAGIGAVKRFANITQAGFERNKFSIEEAQEATLDLAKALGVDLNSALRNINSALQGGFEDNKLTLSEYKEELRENQKELVILDELVSGAIQVFTEFNPLVDANKIANTELSRAFLAAAEGAGQTGTEVQKMASQIADGTLRVEDALIKLNELAGINLDLKDIEIDPANIEATIQLVIDQAGGIEAAFASAISQGISNGLTRPEVEAAFDDFLENFIRVRLIEETLAAALPGLFEGIDLTQPIDAGSDAALILRGRVGDVYDTVIDLLDAAGLLPESFDEASDSADDLDQSLANARSEAEGLVNQIQQLNNEIAALASKKIEVDIRFARNLERVGQITPSESLGVQRGAAETELDFLLGQSAHVATEEPLTADQLQRAIDLNQQLTELTVQRFELEKTKIEEQLATDIENINKNAERFSNAINIKFDGLVKEAQDQATQAIKDLREGAEAERAQIRADFDARRSAIKDSFEAERKALENQFNAAKAAGDARIDALREERRQIQDANRVRIDALREEIRLAEEFLSVAEALGEQIRSLTLSADSPLSAPLQLSFLQRQAADLRGQIAGAGRADLPDLFSQLSDVLGQQLGTGTFQTQDPRQRQLFNRVVAELEDLQAQAAAEGVNLESLEQQTLTVEKSQEARLATIDQQIEQQRDLLNQLRDQERIQLNQLRDQERNQLNQLSKEERMALDGVGTRLESAIQAAEDTRDQRVRALEQQREDQLDRIDRARRAAIQDAEKIANAKIDKLRRETVAELDRLREQEKRLLDRQIRLAEDQKEDLKKQLVELVGIEEATRLLANPEGALRLTLTQINRTLDNLDSTIGNLVPAASGFSGVVDRPTLFLAGEAGPERVLITPDTARPSGRLQEIPLLPSRQQGTQTGGDQTVNIDLSGMTFQVSVDSVEGQSPEQIAEQLGPALASQIKRQLRASLRPGGESRQQIKEFLRGGTL